MEIMSEICDSNNCYGCALCVGICPVKAVSMVLEHGFWHPRINYDKCVKCMKCTNCCPGNDNGSIRRLGLIHHCFATYSKDDKMHFNSASGGLCSEISRQFIKRGGFVAGSWFNPDKQIVEHTIVDNINDLDLLKGSKYVQSNIETIYTELSLRLKQQEGLFIGMPCQVMAIKRYSSELRLEGKLYTIDLICHGGASPECFKEHTNMIMQGPTYKISFRGGVNDCYLCLYDANNTLTYRGSMFSDPYFNCFMEHTIFRPQCYECVYAGAERVGDLTIGDFWGLDKSYLPRTGGNGINVVIINNHRGNNIFNYALGLLNTVERPLTEAIAGNDTLRKPTKKPLEYDDFWAKIESEGFIKALDYYSNNEWDNRVKQCIKETREYKVSENIFKITCNIKIYTIKKFSDKKKIWIYSAGKGARILSDILEENNIKFMGYIDKNWKNIDKIQDKRVISINHIDVKESYVIVALMRYAPDIIEELKDKGFENEQICTIVSE